MRPPAWRGKGGGIGDFGQGPQRLWLPLLGTHAAWALLSRAQRAALCRRVGRRKRGQFDVLTVRAGGDVVEDRDLVVNAAGGVAAAAHGGEAVPRLEV